MDKRTIVFILLVGIAFFGFNFYFGSNRDKQAREELVKKEALQAKKQSLLQADILKRTAPLSTLPLTVLYESDETPIATGILVDGNVLVLAWKSPLPKSIFYKDREGQKKNLQLKTEDSVVGGIALYSPPNFQELSIAALPSVGTYDVQLLFFPSNPMDPQVTLGEYREGALEVLGVTANVNALVLYKTDHTYLPLGLYESQGKIFVPLQDLPILSGFITVSKSELPSSTALQKYYVLENAYQQLVFTNKGGALAEINFPFASENNKKSVINKIGFDRQILKESPENAYFPLHPFYTPNEEKEHAKGALGGYYPLLRRDLTGKTKQFTLPPEYYAANIVSDYPEMASLMYEVTEFTKDKITFVAKQAHRRITKTFSIKNELNGAPYAFDLSILVEGDSRGLWLTSGVPEVEIISNSSSPQIQYRIGRGGKKAVVEKLNLPKPNEIVSLSSVSADWVVDSNGYLGLILDPLTDSGPGFKARAISGSSIPTRLTLIDPEFQPYKSSKYPGYETLMPLPATGGKTEFRIFAGPFEEGILQTVDNYYTDPETGYNPGYISARTFYGWFSFISEPFAKLLFVVMKFFYALTHSWGFSIILLTLFLKILLYPLNAWSFKAMRRMQVISPQVQAIQAKYKKEPKKAQMEVMKLYREKKVNPFSGCLPIIIQIPFLVGMFDLLKSSFQLRGACFIRGWIDNLTAPDVLFSWKMPIFFIGNQFHLLPILLGIVMFLQQRFSSPLPKDKSQWTDQQRQQRAMGSIMTIFFAVMFYHFPSGLNIYWLSSMLLGILQQWITNRVLDKKKKEPEEGKKKSGMKRLKAKA